MVEKCKTSEESIPLDNLPLHSLSIIKQLTDFNRAHDKIDLINFSSRFTKILVDTLHFDLSCLLLFDHTKNVLKVSSVYYKQNIIIPLTDKYNPAELVIKPGEGYIGKTFSNKQSFLIKNTDIEELEENFFLISKDKKSQSILYLPMGTEQKNLGVLILALTDPCIFTDKLQNDLKDMLVIIADILLLIMHHEKLSLLVEELSQHNVLLEDATRVKSDFLTQMRQQMRTPMNGIIGIAQLLQKTELNPQQTKYVDILKASADRLFATIEEILDYSSLSNGNIELVESFVSLREIINKIYQSWKFKAAEKGIEVYNEITEDIPDILYTDPKRLHQVLMLLLGNCLKYSNHGTISLKVSLLETQENLEKIPYSILSRVSQAQKDDNVSILFSISTTSSTIDSDKLEDIFLPFSAVYKSISQDANIGIPLAKCIAEKMNGSIWGESNKKGGNIFHFIIFTRASNLKK